MRTGSRILGLVLATLGCVATTAAVACEYVDPHEDSDAWFSWCRCTGGTPNFTNGIYTCVPGRQVACPALPKVPEGAHCTARRDRNGCSAWDSCKADCFYAFRNPGRVPQDLTVDWIVGSTCSKWPHVHAGKSSPEVEPPYTWANPGTVGDYSVKLALAPWKPTPELRRADASCETLGGVSLRSTAQVYWKVTEEFNNSVRLPANPNFPGARFSGGFACSCRWHAMCVIRETTCRREIEEQATINGARRARRVPVVDRLRQRESVLSEDKLTPGLLRGSPASCTCLVPPDHGNIDRGECSPAP